MTPSPQPPVIPDHDDTAFQILGAYVTKEKRLAAEQAAAEAAEKAAQHLPPTDYSGFALFQAANSLAIVDFSFFVRMGLPSASSRHSVCAQWHRKRLPFLE